MQILSLCPLPVAHLYWRPRRGAVALTVVCKATYDLLPGEARLAQQQDHPNEDDNHWNDDPKASLYSPSDLAPFKPRADVLLVGSAFAPKDKPARSLMTRIVVGAVDKTIEVTRDRHWTQAGELVEGKRFVQMPLRWERAAGGPDSANPVGVDRYGERDAYGRLLAPNLQPPGVNVTTPTDAVDPVCFGPIAEEWPLRRALLGRHAAAWSRRAWNAEVLPTDIDGAYFNAAPPDQRVEEIRPSERMLLEFLHPDEPHLVTQLPGLRPRAFIERGGAVRELPLRGDTLWIDTDRAVCCVTWRGRVELESEHEAGRVLVALEEPGKALGWPEVQKLAAEHDARAPNAAPKTAPKAGQDVSRTDPLGERIDPVRVRPSFPRAAPDREATAVGAMRPAPQNTPLPFMHRAVPPPAPPPPSGTPDSSRREAQKTGGLPVMHPDDRSPAWLMQSVVTQAPPELRALGQKPPPPPVPPPPPPPISSGAPMSAPMSAAVPPAPVSSPGFAPPVPSAVPTPPHTAHPGSMGALPSLGGMASAGAAAAASPWAAGALGSEAGAPELAPAVAATNGYEPLTPRPGPAPMPPAPAIVPGASHVPGMPGLVPPVAMPMVRPLAGMPAPMTEPPPVEAPRDDAVAAVAARPVAREIVELIWYDEASVDKIRKTREWAPILAELNPPVPPNDPLDFDSPPPPETPPELRAERDVVGIMTRARPISGADLHRVMLEAVDESGHFEPPVALIGGKLFFPFDPVEALQATVTAVTPLVAGDKLLQETLDTARELMATPWIHNSGEVADNMTQRVRETFKKGPRKVAPSYLEDLTERILLEQRKYQKRKVFGKEWIRALLTPSLGRTQIPTYLPLALAEELPMFVAFPARLLVEAHVQQDQYEGEDKALKVVALGRVVTFSRSG